MEEISFSHLTELSLAGKPLSRDMVYALFDSKRCDLLPLLNAAFEVRKKFWGKTVRIHILNNAQNGQCSEDCHYCAQSRSSSAPIAEYPLKGDDEIFAEAEAAYKNGAFRYCMVFSGRSQSQKRIEHLATLLTEIKRRYPIEVCVSPGVITEDQARTLKNAGLDRLNHNINTSERLYHQICSTHSYGDRIETLRGAQRAGLQICSGVIVGMGETVDDLTDMAMTLLKYRIESIPVNFFIPIDGVALQNPPALTPDFCLRTLCLFRFLNPRAEIRVAAGRELHLRSMEVLAFYPASSLFMDGYLNVTGESRRHTLQMLKDAGFTIESEIPMDGLLHAEDPNARCTHIGDDKPVLKQFDALRPHVPASENMDVPDHCSIRRTSDG